MEPLNTDFPNDVLRVFVIDQSIIGNFSLSSLDAKPFDLALIPHWNDAEVYVYLGENLNWKRVSYYDSNRKDRLSFWADENLNTNWTKKLDFELETEGCAFED
jgi:hypothetical protein